MVEELLRLKDMLDKGMITREEFDAAKNELGCKPAGVPLQRRPTTKSGFAPSSHKPISQMKTVEKVQCPKCGEDMPSSRMYCSLCGARLPDAHSEQKMPQKGSSQNRWYVLPLLIVFGIAILWWSVATYQKEQTQKEWIDGFAESTAVALNTSPASLATNVPRPTATKNTTNKTTPPKWLLESIGNTVQSSMKDQDVTFWTSGSGVYITIGMPVNKSDFEAWASTFGRVQFDDFCTTMDELNTSAWDVIVHQGYEDSALVSIEVVGTPSGDLLLSYLNGKQSYNFLED
jgi:hypothetical protein